MKTSIIIGAIVLLSLASCTKTETSAPVTAPTPAPVVEKATLPEKVETEGATGIRIEAPVTPMEASPGTEGVSNVSTGFSPQQ